MAGFAVFRACTTDRRCQTHKVNQQSCPDSSAYINLFSFTRTFTMRGAALLAGELPEAFTVTLRQALLLSCLLLLSCSSYAVAESARKPNLDGLSVEERSIAQLYWDYKASDRSTHHEGGTGVAASSPISYRFFVPHLERLAGLAYMGHAARLRLVLERAAQGEALKVGVLGGSISTGSDARGITGTYAALFTEWLNAAFPPTVASKATQKRSTLEGIKKDSSGSKGTIGRTGDVDADGGDSGDGHGTALAHALYNGAVPGTVSSYMSSCMQYHVPVEEVDLFLLEFAVNDDYRPTTDWEDENRRAFERLLRKLLQLPRRPAVALVHMYAAGERENMYWKSAERDFNELASYYGIPAVSLRNAVMPAALSQQPPKELQYKAIFNGSLKHPGQGAHVVVAELLITLCLELLRADQHLKHMLKAAMQHGSSGGEGTTAVRHSRSAKSRGSSKQSTAKGPHSPGDATAAALASVLRRTAFRPLPPPMAPDNWETGGSTCYLQEQLQAMAVAPVSAGWNWTDEGRNKWGWVALEAKQAIRFKLRTAIPNVKSQEPILLQMSYLQSYRDMGAAKLSCESGCKCTPQVIDGWSDRPVSVSVMADIQVSQSKECVLQLATVGPGSSGGNAKACAKDPSKKACRGSKFKVLGFVVGEEPGGHRGVKGG